MIGNELFFVNWPIKKNEKEDNQNTSIKNQESERSMIQDLNDSNKTFDIYGDSPNFYYKSKNNFISIALKIPKIIIILIDFLR